MHSVNDGANTHSRPNMRRQTRHRDAPSGQLELSFALGIGDFTSLSHSDSQPTEGIGRVGNTENVAPVALPATNEPTIINLSAKTTKSQMKFNRRIREERGNRCEVCGTTSDQKQIEAHHVLDRRCFPKHAQNPENIIVVCQPCHTCLTDCMGNMSRGELQSYASLPSALRLRVADFVEKSAPRLTTFIQALRRGVGFADAVFWWKMEHGSSNPPAAYIKRFEQEAVQSEECEKSHPETPHQPKPQPSDTAKKHRRRRQRRKKAAARQRNLAAWSKPYRAARAKYHCKLKGFYK